MDDIGTLEPLEPIVADEIEEAPRPRRRGRPPGSRNKPKPVDVPEYEAAEGLPTRGRRTGTRRTAKLTPKQVSDLAMMAHTMAAASLGPKASISQEQADALGEAIVPVLEDYGVRLASKMVHLVVLITTVVMVEGPVAMGVMQEAQKRAVEARNERRLNQTIPQPPTVENIIQQEPLHGAFFGGVEIGAPNIEAA